MNFTNGHSFIYALVEGPVPTPEFCKDYEGADVALKTLFDAYFAANPSAKPIAVYQCRSLVSRPASVSGSVPVSNSSKLNSTYTHKNDGTPTWVIMGVYDYRTVLDIFTSGSFPMWSVVGQVGEGKDIQLSKTPLTEYSDLNIADLILNFNELKEG